MKILDGFRTRMTGLVDFMKDQWLFERKFRERKLSR